MKAGKTLSGTVLCTLFFSFLAHASPDPVQGDDSGYWARGILVGKVGPWVPKWFGNDLSFLLGSDPAAGDGSYFSQILPTYTNPVFSRVVNSNCAVALRYTYLNPFNPRNWFRTKYYVEGVEKDEFDFEKTPSGKRNDHEFKEPFPSHHGRWKEGQKSGTFIHVSRWGTGLFGKTCTVWLHEGTEQETVKKERTKNNWELDRETNQLERVITMESYDETVSVLRVSLLNIYSESGCLFAEDAARSRALVSVDYSSALFEIWNRYPLTIHSIRVSEENNYSSEVANVSNLPSDASHSDERDTGNLTKAPTPQFPFGTLQNRLKNKNEQSIKTRNEVQTIQEAADPKTLHKVGLNPPLSKKSL